MNSSLIGTSAWNPYGESFLSVVRRIAFTNQFDLRGVGELVGSNKRLTFEAVMRSDPDNTIGIKPTKVAELAGWDPEVLSHAFSRSHSWKNGYLEPNRAGNLYESNGYMAKAIKLCPQCAKNQKHYTFHQLQGWTHCPLHGAALIDRCPSCETEFGPYWFDENIDKLVTSCRRCGWLDIDRAKINLSQTREIDTLIDEYRLWLSIVDRSISGTHPDIKIMGKLDARKDIERIQELIPGPSWLKRCVDTGCRMRTTEWSIDDLAYQAREFQGEEKLSIDSEGMTIDEINSFLPKASSVGVATAKSLCKELYELTIEQDDFELDPGVPLCTPLSEEIHYGITLHPDCFVDWIEQITTYIPYTPSIDFTEQDSGMNGLLSDCQFKRWNENGPGDLIWYETKKGWTNNTLALKTSSIWWRVKLLEAYFNVWASAVLKVHERSFLVSSGRFDQYPYIEKMNLIDHSIFVIRRVDGKARLIALNSFGDPEEVLRALANGKFERNPTKKRKDEIHSQIVELFGLTGFAANMFVSDSPATCSHHLAQDAKRLDS